MPPLGLVCTHLKIFFMLIYQIWRWNMNFVNVICRSTYSTASRKERVICECMLGHQTAHFILLESETCKLLAELDMKYFEHEFILQYIVNLYHTFHIAALNSCKFDCCLISNWWQTLKIHKNILIMAKSKRSCYCTSKTKSKYSTSLELWLLLRK